MPLPINLKHFPTAGLPKGFYQIVDTTNVVVQTKAGARARACLVIREHGRAGYSYFAQDGDKWVSVLWEQDGVGHPIDVTLDVSPEDKPATKPAQTPVKATPPASKPSGKTEIKQLNGKPYEVHPDGRWVAIERTVPAPVF